MKKEFKISKDFNFKQKYPRNYRGIVENISKSSKNTQSIFDSPHYKLTVVIPAYNEENRLEFMLKDTFKSLLIYSKSSPLFNCEVILADDGSKDGTASKYGQVVSTFPNNPKIDFKMIKLGKNSGKGKAVSEVIVFK